VQLEHATCPLKNIALSRAELTADDRYAPLLRTLPETDDDTATAIAADVLPAAAKTTLVLESRADIIAAEKGLREIDVYNKRGVAGAEGLDGE